MQASTRPAAVLPLKGLGILVTRPRSQAERLMAEIARRGGTAWWLPGLEIEPPANPAVLNQALEALPQCQWAIFVSPTAVEQAWPAIMARGGLPAGLRLAAVGRGTARELAARGVTEVLAPSDQADSEALLALPQLAAVEGLRVILFRGEDGRTLLAEVLTARGAQVIHAVCYRRVRPQADPGAVLKAWRAGRIAAVTVFSRDSLDGLFELLGTQGQGLLQQTPLFVPHPRIAEHARQLGCTEVIVTPAGEAGVLAALEEFAACV